MRFDYHRPSTLEDAVTHLARADGATRPLAYGSDLLVWTKARARSSPEAVVDLTALEELRLVEEEPAQLTLGACLTLAEVGRLEVVRRRFPALAAAIGTMGSVQLREGASLGGNICSASPAGDSGPPLLVYEALFVVVGPRGLREIPAADFYRGPGRTVLEQGDLVVAVKLPWPPAGAVGTYEKGARRAAVDLALVSVAAIAWPDESAPSGVALRMGLGAVAPTPVRATAAEELVRSLGLSDDPSSEAGRALGSAALRSARPIDDQRASASYRGVLLAELAARAAARLTRELAESNA